MSDIKVALVPVTVFQQNCSLVWDPATMRAAVIDPGGEPGKILDAITRLGLRVELILLTHGHLDHIGAVGAVAGEATSPVYTSAGDRAVVAHINDHLWPGFGPYVEHEPEGTLEPGVPLTLAGMTIDVFATPGHYPYAVSLLLTGPDGSQLLAAGDVLFAGSVGRTDLDGGDWDVLEQSIALLMREVELDTHVLPGHGPVTTLRHELATNPFLGGLRP